MNVTLRKRYVNDKSENIFTMSAGREIAAELLRRDDQGVIWVQGLVAGLSRPGGVVEAAEGLGV